MLLGLIILPLNLIQTIGIGCATALLFTMAVTLSMLPAMIFRFPKLFTRSCLPASNQGLRSTSVKLRNKSFGELLKEEEGVRLSPASSITNSAEMPMLGGGTEMSTACNIPSAEDQATLNRQLESHKKSLWYKVGLITQSRVGSLVIMIICTLFVYFPGKEAFNPTLSTTLTGFLPRGGGE